VSTAWGGKTQQSSVTGDGKPASAIKTDQKQLLDGLIVGRARSDSDPGTDHPEFEVEVGGLLHRVRTRQIITAFPESLHQSPRARVARHIFGSEAIDSEALGMNGNRCRLTRAASKG